ADQVHVGLRRADVLGGDVAAVQALDEAAVGPEERLAAQGRRVADDDRLATAQVVAADGVLVGHRPGEAAHVDERLLLGGVGVEAGPPERRPERRRVDGDDRPETGGGVVEVRHLLELVGCHDVEDSGHAPRVVPPHARVRAAPITPRRVAAAARRGTGYREVRRRGYVPSVASPTAAYSIRLRVRLDNRPGSLGRLATAIGDAGGNITAIGGFDVRGPVLEEDLVVNCRDEAHIAQVRAAAEGLEGCEVLEVLDRTFLMHDGGKIEVLARMPVNDRDDPSMAYTPGVARVCQAIAQDPQRVHDLTIKKNTVAIVSDGSAVLGLGRIGPEAALPVMEGKALLFKHFAGVDAF